MNKPVLFVLLFLMSTLFVAQNFNYLPTSTTNQIVYHTNYTLSYSEVCEQAEWVAYELKKERLNDLIKRFNNFKIDSNIMTGSAELKDYKYSGYDRGHLAPAADMNFSQLAMDESFYMSNISPQNKSFNSGIWKKLEFHVRYWAKEYNHLYVISAGVLDACENTIGDNKVCVPEYFYKVILDYKSPEIKAIGFLLPNKKGNQPLTSYVVSIDSIEALTGIDFFADIPDQIEKRIEKKSHISEWKWK